MLSSIVVTLGVLCSTSAFVSTTPAPRRTGTGLFAYRQTAKTFDQAPRKVRDDVVEELLNWYPDDAAAILNQAPEDIDVFEHGKTQMGFGKHENMPYWIARKKLSYNPWSFKASMLKSNEALDYCVYHLLCDINDEGKEGDLLELVRGELVAKHASLASETLPSSWKRYAGTARIDVYKKDIGYVNWVIDESLYWWDEVRSWFFLKPIIDEVNARANAQAQLERQRATEEQGERMRAERRKLEAEITDAVEARVARKIMDMYQGDLDVAKSELARVRGQLSFVETQRDAALEKSSYGEYRASRDASGGTPVLEFPYGLGHVSNVVGSTGQAPPSGYTSWKDFWTQSTGKPFPDKCQYAECDEKATLGAHVIRISPLTGTSEGCCILPACSKCNHPSFNDFDEGGVGKAIKTGATLVPVPESNELKTSAGRWRERPGVQRPRPRDLNRPGPRRR